MYLRHTQLEQSVSIMHMATTGELMWLRLRLSRLRIEIDTIEATIIKIQKRQASIAPPTIATVQHATRQHGNNPIPASSFYQTLKPHGINRRQAAAALEQLGYQRHRTATGVNWIKPPTAAE